MGKVIKLEPLKPCPCGKTPKKVYVEEGQSCKWAMVYGDCCGEWNVEFRTQYLKIGSEELHKFAVEEWNEAPRGK